MHGRQHLEAGRLARRLLEQDLVMGFGGEGQRGAIPWDWRKPALWPCFDGENVPL